MLEAVKETLTKEVDVKEFLEMEIELTKLKELLATEIKIKEFLVQEIDLKNLMPVANTDDEESELKLVNQQAVQQLDEDTEKLKAPPKKRELPAYDLSLINNLTEEHRELRFIYDELMRYAVDHDYEKAANRLEQLNTTIRDHYRRADTDLYAYLKTYIQIKHPKREKAFTQLSLEMKNISIEIFYTISQSPNLPLKKETHRAFMKEFIHFGKLMNERIIRETRVLFKMYEETHEAKTIS